MWTGVIQATAAAQGDLETFLHKSAHHLPVPIGPVEANLCWKLLHHCLQFGLLHSVDRGAEPPDCKGRRENVPRGRLDLSTVSESVLTNWPA